jgi:signal transduction histidine kinase
MKKVIAVLVGCLFLVGYAYAAAPNTKEGSMELAKKAIAHYKQVGKEKAFAEFNDPKGQFSQGNYVVVYGLDDKLKVHPYLAQAVKDYETGKTKETLSKSKDADGKFFLKTLLERAKKEGSGWFDYRYANPFTKKIGEKSAYFEKVDDYVFSVGYWK